MQERQKSDSAPAQIGQMIIRDSLVIMTGYSVVNLTKRPFEIAAMSHSRYAITARFDLKWAKPEFNPPLVGFTRSPDEIFSHEV